MLKYVLFLQIAFTLACTHFAFAIPGGANQDAYSRSADKQEIRAMPVPAEDSAPPAVKTDNGVQLIADQGDGQPQFRLELDPKSE
jgi:hypothetical protein